MVHLIVQLVCWTAACAFLLPPASDAALVEAAKTLQSSHFVPRLELFEADDALDWLCIFAQAIFLRGFVDEHTPARHASMSDWRTR